MSATGSGSIPATLGRYRVLRRLGAGGMAEVFLARSSGAEGIEKTLVVKRVLPSIAKRTRFISMFVDEAKLATRLNHPNIVQVYNFEQVRGEFLLAMEYVAGADLARLLVRGRDVGVSMPPPLAAWIVAEAAKGLDYAHRRTDERGQPMDIVHRDVSPQNILIGYEGAVKIADFGIARARSFEPQAGVIQGKFAYMSPEQARGAAVDQRSDVYGLGAVLTELLAGRPLFERGARVLDAVRKGQVPRPRDLNPEVPEALDAVARRAMATEPEDRFESAREMLRALGQYLHTEAEPVDPATLEAWLDEVMPADMRQGESGAASGLPPPPGSPEAASGPGPHEARERRPVLVVVGQLVGGDAGGEPGLGQVATRILDDIAFKADAVLGWEDDTELLERRTFRMVLGLGESGVSEPLRAVRLALDVLDALGSLSEGDRTLLAAGLGLSRGIASVQRDEDGRLRSYQPEDDAFALAAALARGSRRGEVLAAGEVYRLSRREFAFDEAAAREVALVLGDEDVTPQAVRAYPLIGARGYDQRVARRGPGAWHGPLVGRDALVALLERSVFEALRDRAQRALRVTGALGVGKTAVVLAALERVGTGARCVHLECGYGSARDSLSALRQLMHLALGFAPGQAPSHVVETVRALLGEHDPDGELSRHAARLLEGGWLEPSDQRLERTTRTVAAVLGALARERALLLCVDALQWIDDASLAVLSALARGSHPGALVFWLCGRVEPAVDRALEGVPDHVVDELPPAAARELLARCLGVEQVPHALSRAVLSRAGGNPLFIVEIAEAMRERGDLSLETDPTGARFIAHVRDPGALPAALEDVVSARLLQLGTASLATLRWLSVVGAPIDDAELAELMGVADAEAVADLLKRSILHRDARGRLAFANPVLRQVALDGVDLRDRASMQRRVEVELLAARPYLRAVVQARELEVQGVGREAARGFAAASREARQLGELPDALRYLARALTLLPVVDAERIDLHRARVSLLRLLGRLPALGREIDALRELAEASGDARARGWAFAFDAERALEAGDAEAAVASLDVARAVESSARDVSLSVLVSVLDARLAWQRGDRGPAEAALVRLSSRARDSVDPEVRARVRLLGCELARHDRDYPALKKVSLGAMHDAVRGGDPAALALAAESLALCCVVEGALEDALWLLRGGQAGVRDAGVVAGAPRRLFALGELYADLADVVAARAHLERACELAARVGDIRLSARGALELLRMELYVSGDTGRAEAALGRMLGLSGVDPALLSLARGHLAAHAGHWPVAEPALRDALAADPSLGSPLIFAELSMARGVAGDHEGERSAALEAFGMLTERPCARGLERAHARVHHALGHARLFELRERIGVRAQERLTLCSAQFRDDHLRQVYLNRWRRELGREVHA